MKSPLHPDSDLIECELETGLTAWKCPKSNGYWITAPCYWHWHSLQDLAALQNLQHPSREHTVPIPQNQDRQALLCPESHCILLRYHVSGDLECYVDRSPATGGIWLDAGEWEALKDRGMHASLHMIFSSRYQRKVMIEKSEKTLDEQFFNDLSPSDRECVTDMLQWLKDHPMRRRILAWLLQRTSA